jgi:putative Mn2+ efflux pump MntP
VEVPSIPEIRIFIKTISPILAAILLIGGGNWLITKSVNDEQSAEIHQLLQQVQALRSSLEEIEKQQKEVLEKADTALAGQSQQLVTSTRA